MWWRRIWSLFHHSVIKTRPRSSSSNPQPMMKNIPEGLVFISLMNKNYRYFVPSTKNYFGGIKVSKVLCDSGCSSLLLPIINREELDNIFKMHSDTCFFSISESQGVGGKTLCLMVRSRGLSANMEVQLCCDVLGGGSTIVVDYLRFSLCSQDIDDLLSKYADKFSDLDQFRLLQEHNKSQEIRQIHDKYDVANHESSDSSESTDLADRCKRREYALLGQKIMRGLCCIKHMNCELYVDAAVYKLPENIQALENQMRELRDQLNMRLPMDFNDWEDDDFVFQDDDAMTEHDFR